MKMRIESLTDKNSALKPAELQVLRSQYEKEGEHVGVQTKFNFAWVHHPSLCAPAPQLSSSTN
jgi:fission 1 protein